MPRKVYRLRTRISTRVRPLFSRKVQIIILAFCLVLLPTLLYRFITNTTDVLTLKRIGNGTLNLRPLLQELDNPANKEVLLPWLKRYWHLYQLEDPELLHAITALCPFTYHAQLSSYQQRIALCEQSPIIASLRALSGEKLPPFQPKGWEVRIGIPAVVNQPKPGVVNTCFEGVYENKKLLLFSSYRTRPIAVQVKGAYHCDNIDNYPDLQLNEAQAKALFNRKVRKIEYLMVLENVNGNLQG